MVKKVVGIFCLLATAVLITAVVRNRIMKPSICRQCDVIILDIDVLRADALKCDDPKPIAPNLCRYMRTGFVFANHIAQNDGTLGSAVSALTSRYPSSHGMWFPPILDIPKDIPTLPQVLASQGYELNFSAKFTTPPQINPKWFGSVLTIPELREYLSGEIIRKTPRFIYVYFDDLHWPYLFKNKLSWDASDIAAIIPDGQLSNLPKTAMEYNASLSKYIGSHYKELFTEDTVRSNPQIFTGDSATRDDRIFDFYRKIMNDRKTRPSDYINISWMPQYKAVEQFIDYRNPKHSEYLHTRYLAVLKALDEELAPLLKQLSDPVISSRTIVIVKSDHGEEFMEHGNFNHYNNLYQELIHIPFSISAPNIKNGSTELLSQDIDLMPTVFELLGLPETPGMQGESLMPIIKYRQSVNSIQIAQKNYLKVASIRQGDWKLIIKNAKPFQLFHLLSDPKEQLSVLEKEPEISKSLFLRYTNSIPDYNSQPPEGTTD